jgi:hypothetical protein
LAILGMRNSPQIDANQRDTLRLRYCPDTADVTIDPLTDQSLDYNELVEDIVTKPLHGYSRFHIGHQDPKLQPKHMPGNVRWQFKASNDFQGAMAIQVARIAFLLNEFKRTGDKDLLERAQEALKAFGETTVVIEGAE